MYCRFGLFGLSPALNNAAFSLYSEIAALPLTLGIILASFYAWDAIEQNLAPRAYFFGALLGIMLLSATLIKGIFECLTPVYLIIFFAAIYFIDQKIN